MSEQRIREHAIDRVRHRLADIGISEHRLRCILWRLAVKYSDRKSVAVLISPVRFHGDNRKPFLERTDSNGDLLYIIIREGVVRTAMFRRSDQRNTPTSLRVEVIELYDGGRRELHGRRVSVSN